MDRRRDLTTGFKTAFNIAFRISVVASVVAVIAVFAIGEGKLIPRGPISHSNPSAAPPAVDSSNGFPISKFSTAPEILIFDTVFPDLPVQLILFDGMPAISAGRGLSYVSNAQGTIHISDNLVANFVSDSLPEASVQSDFISDVPGEIHARAARGDTLWMSRIDAGPMVVLTLGLDSLVYSLWLSTASETEQKVLAVFDPQDGRLIRSGIFDSRYRNTLAVDEEGRSYLLDEWRVLTGRSADARPAFREFDLPLLGGGTLKTEDIRGKVTVVNFWASWCGPCREEMPQLAALDLALPEESFQVVTFNEDIQTRAAGAFLTEMNLSFEFVAMGRGSLKRRYGYVGLPHTVLLDRNARVVYSWTGFGREEQMLQLKNLAVREIGEAR